MAPSGAGEKGESHSGEKFTVKSFHSLEFWCADATSAHKRFSYGLGMPLVAKSDHSTGNYTFASYAVRSNDVIFAFTSPFHPKAGKGEGEVLPEPGYDPELAFEFVKRHGTAIRAIGIRVEDAHHAYSVAHRNGAVPVLSPTELRDNNSFGKQVVAEVLLYGDVVLRFIANEGFEGPFLAGYEEVDTAAADIDFERIDHCVGNVHEIRSQVDYMMRITGFHKFAQFNAEEVGTRESGLNSIVTASDNQLVLLPVNEPTHGTKRKSQIQMYLEENEGPGVQHVALKTPDIFKAVREMRKRAKDGGFDFMPQPPDSYYRNVPHRVGKNLSPEQYREIEELGILADVDDEGVLLQVFTKPLFDRPTIFLEIIQRIGCMRERDGVLDQKPGCGGFGKGNFRELFKSIERYEDETLKQPTS